MLPFSGKRFRVVTTLPKLDLSEELRSDIYPPNTRPTPPLIVTSRAQSCRNKNERNKTISQTGTSVGGLRSYEPS